jgi:predicted DNA-binding protein YlxM (UPF0122 family)
MDERVEISLLLDVYGELLTEKQKEIMAVYFNEDLSLSEISEITNTSRQAIHDLIKRCHKLLMEYEGKLHLLEKAEENRKLKTELMIFLKELKKKDASVETVDVIENLQKKIADSL